MKEEEPRNSMFSRDSIGPELIGYYNSNDERMSLPRSSLGLSMLDNVHFDAEVLD